MYTYIKLMYECIKYISILTNITTKKEIIEKVIFWRQNEIIINQAYFSKTSNIKFEIFTI